MQQKCVNVAHEFFVLFCFVLFGEGGMGGSGTPGSQPPSSPIRPCKIKQSCREYLRYHVADLSQMLHDPGTHVGVLGSDVKHAEVKRACSSVSKIVMLYMS